MKKVVVFILISSNALAATVHDFEGYYAPSCNADKFTIRAVTQDNANQPCENGLLFQEGQAGKVEPIYICNINGKGRREERQYGPADVVSTLNENIIKSVASFVNYTHYAEELTVTLQKNGSLELLNREFYNSKVTNSVSCTLAPIHQ